MTATISKWGNSQGFRLPKGIMKDLNLSIGDTVELERRDRTLIITPLKPKRKKFNIRDLVKELPEDYKPHEVFSDTSGREAW